jgi:aminoglycoside phosphotransferase (APT) family kinase protein
MTATTDVDEIRADLEKGLVELLGREVEVLSLGLLAGGASKEAWSVDVATDGETLELLLRRATGGAIFTQMLSISDEYRVLDAAYRAGVTVPRPYGYLDDVAGKDAFLMARVKGETIGRRIVRKPELAPARELLPLQMAQEMARIHSIALEQVPFVAGPEQLPSTPAVLDSLQDMLDGLPEPHPAIELGLRWLRDHTPTEHGLVLIHADFRLGNFIIDERGIAAVLDWEVARRGDPAEDLSWALLRAWRFGVDDKRLAGVGDVEPYLDRYNELTGREVSMRDLFYWELAGNVRWAMGSVRQGLRHTSGEERSVELAVIGRLASEVEYEILDMLERAG